MSVVDSSVWEEKYYVVHSMRIVKRHNAKW